jgi:cytochrome c556
MRLRSWAAATTGCITAAFACSGPAQWRYEDAVERTPAPAVHAVHEERLSALMRSLDRLREERLPKALDPREEEDRQAQEIARVARSLAESAARIDASTPDGLDTRRQAEFRALAKQLEQQCNQLAEDAPLLSAQTRRDRVGEIDATCDRCHGSFRIPGIQHAED